MDTYAEGFFINISFPESNKRCRGLWGVRPCDITLLTCQSPTNGSNMFKVSTQHLA